MQKAILVIGLLLLGKTNIKLGANIRNFMSSRPLGKQTVSTITHLSKLFPFIQVVTDILHNVVIIFQGTVVLLTAFTIGRVFQPLPCFVVSLFSGSWQFALLPIFFIQLCIIFHWTCILDWEENLVFKLSSAYAFLFAVVGLVSDVILVSITIH